MTRRFHLFAHHQFVAALARKPGGMDNYIAHFTTADDAKQHLAEVNANLVATKGGTASYDYAQIAVLADTGGLIVVATFDKSTGWSEQGPCGCDTGACDSDGPLDGYIVRRPVKDRTPIGFAASDALIDAGFGVTQRASEAAEAPMGYVLVKDPRPGEEIYHGRFERRRLGLETPAVAVYDPVGAFTTSRFGA